MLEGTQTYRPTVADSDTKAKTNTKNGDDRASTDEDGAQRSGGLDNNRECPKIAQVQSRADRAEQKAVYAE